VTETPTDPAALKAGIVRTRQELGQTIEALAAKTDVKARAKESARELLSRARGTARDLTRRAAQPAPAVLFAAGVVLAIFSVVAWRRRA
jgi:hypothetical protein